MGRSSGHAPDEGDTGPLAGRDFFAGRRDMVDGFVARHFTWPGTLRLHGAALGWDILKAPLNVLLSPILVLTRLAAFLVRRAGLRGAADWLDRRRILLRTSVARRVEVLVARDLLGIPLGPEAALRDPSALPRAILAAPQLREMIRQRPSAAAAEALGQRIAGTLGTYASTRSAVAEMTTTLCILVIGALVFQALTPGLISMAPDVASSISRSQAIASFPLGQTLGGVWYGVLGVRAAPWLIGASVAGLIMLGSVFTAFAGVIADPVQSRLGIHHRRLGRLIDTLEADVTGGAGRPFAAREHVYARILDLWDAAASAVRLFRS
ncbi:DUF6635 family protein [Anianabacter salinae]|uniref:DUF6635 family protein n=1 Tax=Anianabacter salinae TaxID=2851023 RepID=UPI00225E3224|nr:DUF6635 family protein [Anianabacter salinae]MBV0912056.1 hypothetical protein [Anianabacter salinae]